MSRMTFTVTGAPRTKKNGARIVTRPFPKLLPSKAWEDWRDGCKFIARDARGEWECWPDKLMNWGSATCNCKATFYVDTLRHVDANNLYSGLADLLQHHGVVDDDKCIIAWDGSRVFLDRKNPRTVVELTEMAPTLLDDKPARKRSTAGMLRVSPKGAL